MMENALLKLEMTEDSAVGWAGRLASCVFGFLLAACATPNAAENPASASTRLQTAEAMFKERCKTAGEKIHRTVEDVEGVFLMKLRPERHNFSRQFDLDDPYGRDLGGKEGYIGSFLSGFFEANYVRPQAPGSSAPPHIGYRYVEAVDPNDGQRYRYTGSKKAVGRKDASAPNVQIDLRRNPDYDLNTYAFVLDKIPALGPVPRYGITYDDISTREEREHWIAGSTLRIIDLTTNEVIAERIGYMMDRGQGDRSGGRSPWLMAADYACPEFAPVRGATAQQLQTENFVEKVLKPKRGN